MGNATSSPNGANRPPYTNINNLSKEIDDIAIHYILKQNTIDLLRLTDKEYYDNLIILTSKIIDHRLNNMEIGVLNNRVNGTVPREKNDETIGEAIFSLIPETDKIKNKMIINISKFYIKIITIYSAIVSTIDPQYSYEDEQGQKQVFYLKDIDDYKHIPRGTTPMITQISNPMNLCRKRLNILKNKLDMSDPDIFVLNPGEKLCDNDSHVKLSDEVGIKELDLLYYDIFDYEKKTWSKRSRKMDIIYKKELTLFYQIFTGKSKRPPEVKSFRDIELLDYRTLEYCRPNDLFMKEIEVSKNNEQIREYLDNIKMIEDSTVIYRQKLSEILKKIFVMTVSSVNESNREMFGGFFWKKEEPITPTVNPLLNLNYEYTINPELTLEQIKQLEEETRTTIMYLYTNCQKNFIKALLTFEKIYDEQSKNISEERLNQLNTFNSSQPLSSSQPINGLKTDTFSNLQSISVPLYKTSFNQPNRPINTMIPETPSKEQLFKTAEPHAAYDGIEHKEQMITNSIPKQSSDAISYHQSLPSMTPIHETPVQETPLSMTPVQETPVQETPVQETPLSMTPVQETPVQETPLSMTPIPETPVQETPLNMTPIPETPVQETPLNMTPVQETPLNMTPVRETPIPETPVQETPLQTYPKYINQAPPKQEYKPTSFIDFFANKISPPNPQH